MKTTENVAVSVAGLVVLAAMGLAAQLAETDPEPSLEQVVREVVADVNAWLPRTYGDGVVKLRVGFDARTRTLTAHYVADGVPSDWQADETRRVCRTENINHELLRAGWTVAARTTGPDGRLLVETSVSAEDCE